ncbi:hypothetical protein PR048_018587 [Dryococelus australis]|uniref:YqaJ viral recombinase domain-containing protein n=1 Tax=Dryococelus australis TaxID=614101 RepID=A0ABQ9HCW7_9NEOP|nr:hypothetical protein PR048_018587 [Dryococelus australis]
MPALQAVRENYASRQDLLSKQVFRLDMIYKLRNALRWWRRYTAYSEWDIVVPDFDDVTEVDYNGTTVCGGEQEEGNKTRNGGHGYDSPDSNNIALQVLSENRCYNGTRSAKINLERLEMEMTERLKTNKRGPTLNTGSDEPYGPHAAAPLPDTPDEKLAVLKEEYLRSLQEECTDERRRAIQSNTKDQTTSQGWREQRRKRITASCFGKICRMRTTTSCASVVEYIHYPIFSGNADTRWGTEMEATAFLSVSETLGKKIENCGSFIHKEYPYLGATPDGVIEESAIVEIKCPSSA